MQVPSLGQEDPWEEEMETCFVFLFKKVPWTEEPTVDYSPWSHKESDIAE